MRERADRADRPGEELLDFTRWCRDRGVVPTPRRFGVTWSQRERERWDADQDLERRRRRDEYRKWLAARVNWADAHGGWPVMEWELVFERGVGLDRRRERPGAPAPSQRP
jgi:hypothetical protein